MRTYVRVRLTERPAPSDGSSGTATGRIRAYRTPGWAGFKPALEFTSMDVGAGGEFPLIDAAPQRPADRPRRSDPEAPDRNRAEPGDAGTALGDPPDLDLAHRVGADQPDLGQCAAHRHRPDGDPARIGGTRRGLRAETEISRVLGENDCERNRKPIEFNSILSFRKGGRDGSRFHWEGRHFMADDAAPLRERPLLSFLPGHPRATLITL